MRNGERLSLEQIQAFLEASEDIEFEATQRDEIYAWITNTLCDQEYWKQPETRTDAKGKQRRLYRWYATPWEILRQLPDLARHLRPDVSRTVLDQRAGAESDVQAARNMQKAKQALFTALRAGTAWPGGVCWRHRGADTPDEGL